MVKAVWGIDVSKFSVKAVRLERDQDRLRLSALDVVEIEAAPGDAEGAEFDEPIRKALRTLRSRNPMRGDVLYFSLPSHSVFNRLIKLPPVDPEKIGEIVRYEAQQQIPYPLDEVIWDYQKVERQYAPGEEAEVILFAIKREVVNQFIANVQAAGLDVDIIQFSPVALYNYMMFDQDVSVAAVMLDMGADNTDLVIIDGSKFWIRNLPITGNDITKAVAKAFNMNMKEAEKLKVGAAKSPQAGKVFGAIQPVLKDLVGEIHRSLGFYKTISRQIRFDKLFLMGSATRTVNLQKFISQSIQLPAVRIEALTKIAVSPGCDRGLLDRYLGTMGAAIGLGVQGMDLAANRVNLVPAEIRAAKEFRRKRPFFAAAAAVFFAVAVMMHLKASGEAKLYAERVEELKKRDAEIKDMSKTFETARDAEAFSQPLDTLRKLSPERDLAQKVVDAVHKLLPDNSPNKTGVDQMIWILHLDTTEEAAPVEEAAAGAQPGGAAPPAAGAQPVTRSGYPSDWILTVNLYAGITHRNVQDARNFLKVQLGKKIADQFHVEKEGQDWDVSFDATITDLDPNLQGDLKGEFDRLKLYWKIKVGEERRKPAPPPEKKP